MVDEKRWKRRRGGEGLKHHDFGDDGDDNGGAI